MLASSRSSPLLHAASPRCTPNSTASRRPRAPSASSSGSSTGPATAASATLSATPGSRKIASQSPAAAPRAAGTLYTAAGTQTKPLAPKTADAGTQYTPPDWPPTSCRSSLRSVPAVDLTSAGSFTTHRQLSENPPVDPGAQQRPEAPPALSQTVASPHAGQHEDRDSPDPSPPPEPPLRVVPTSTVTRQSAIRRPLSENSSTDTSTTTSSSGDSNKRARHEDSSRNKGRKMLPADYSQCPPKTLAAVIASMLMRLIAHNDKIPLQDGQLTRFHSRAPPGISVHDYLARLTFHGTLSPPILLSMVFFIDRLTANYSKFIINSLTVHRFLITAATAAAKGLSDSFWTNQVYARVGGVSVKELALLELELLTQCDWKIVPKPEDLVDYYRGLVKQSDEYVLEDDDGQPAVTPSRSGATSVMSVAALASEPGSDPASSGDAEKGKGNDKQQGGDSEAMEFSDDEG